MLLPPALERTLVRVSSVMDGSADPWWIIASAAVALHGVQDLTVGDVDVLVSERDARRVLGELGIEPLAGGGSEKFRSKIIARWTEPPLGVEFMAGFHVRMGSEWTEVGFATREAVRLRDRLLFIPSRRELRQMLLTFGRPKDLARARLLTESA